MSSWNASFVPFSGVLRGITTNTTETALCCWRVIHFSHDFSGSVGQLYQQENLIKWSVSSLWSLIYGPEICIAMPRPSVIHQSSNIEFLIPKMMESEEGFKGWLDRTGGALTDGVCAFIKEDQESLFVFPTVRGHSRKSASKNGEIGLPQCLSLLVLCSTLTSTNRTILCIPCCSSNFNALR